MEHFYRRIKILGTVGAICALIGIGSIAYACKGNVPLAICITVSIVAGQASAFLSWALRTGILGAGFPCNIGDTLWCINEEAEVEKCECTGFLIQGNVLCITYRPDSKPMDYVSINPLGLYVYLSKEEAEFACNNCLGNAFSTGTDEPQEEKPEEKPVDNPDDKPGV